MSDRKLGPIGAGALVAGNMIGSGVFLLPATLAAIGSITLLGWIITTAGILVLGLVFAALASLRPQAAGMTGYIQEGVGSFFGFQSVFLYWCSLWTGDVAIAVALIGYLAVFASMLKDGTVAGLAAAGAIVIMGAVNLIGPRFIGRLSGLTLLLGVPPLVAVGVLGWTAFDSGLWAKAWNVSGHGAFDAVQASLAQLVWLFLGVESAAVAAKVVRDPERNVAKATIGGVLVAAVVYISACTAIFGLLPVDVLAKSTAPFADATRPMFGRAAALFVAACAVLKLVGTLGGWVLMSVETTESAADVGYFPRWFSRGSGGEPPRLNLLFNLGLMVAVALLTISPTVGQQFNVLINIAVVLSTLVYAFACVSLLKLSAEGPRKTGRRALAVLGLGFCAWVVVLSLADPVMLKLTIAALIATVPFFFLRKLWGAVKPG